MLMHIAWAHFVSTRMNKWELLISFIDNRVCMRIILRVLQIKFWNKNINEQIEVCVLCRFSKIFVLYFQVAVTYKQ